MARSNRFCRELFFLAIKAQVDIVPVALVGTYELLPIEYLSHQVPAAGDARGRADFGPWE